MAVTISTHNGSTVHRGHNVRDERAIKNQKHIDKNGNYEIWKDETERNAYKRLFGKAQEEYNAKQTRADRRIKDYYRTVENDGKKHTAYEMIVSIGNSRAEMVNNETGREILKEFVDGWSERNPNLELIGAYYHADEEGVPHVHCDYVPVAHGYKRGMETQTGLVKALGEMGFEKKGKATAQIQWQARENKHLEELCLERGIDVLHPERDAKQHLDTREYKQRQRIDMMDEQLDKMAMEVVTATKQCEEEELRLKKTSRKTARLLKKLDELQSDGEPVTLKLNMIGERTFKPLGSLISEIKEQEAYKSALMKEIDEYERNTTLHKQMQAEVLQNSLEYLRKRYDA